MQRYGSGKSNTPEGLVTKAIRDTLRACNIWHYKAWGGPMSAKGIPDIVGCYNGRFFAIEVKAPKGSPSPDQSTFLDLIKKAGGIAFVAKSVEDVIEGLGLQDRFLGFK
jgi:hypothetical protein